MSSQYIREISPTVWEIGDNPTYPVADVDFSRGLVNLRGTVQVKGTTLTATGAELNLLNTATAGTIVASKAVVVDAAKAVNEWNVAGLMAQTVTVTGTALGTTRGVYGQVTVSGTDIASGNAAGVRGLVTLSGTITAGGAYLYGAQGKLAVTGTMNHADARLTAGLAQLDISAGTYTSGQLSAMWVDAGASASASAIATKGGGQFNLLRLTNTTAASTNALIFGYGDSDYFADLGAPGGSGDWFDASSAEASACSGHIKINLNGTPAYIRVYAAEA